MTITVTRTVTGRTLAIGENTAEAIRQASRAETAAAALVNTTLTVVKSATTIDVYSAELLPLSNRYVRTRMERFVDAPNRYDVWRHAGTWLAQRIDGAFADIVQIASGAPDVMAREFGKASRMGDGVQVQNVIARFYADERRLAAADTGTFSCRTFTAVQNGEMFEVNAAVAGTSRARVRTQRVFTSYGHLLDWEVEFHSEAWSMETLEVGNFTLIAGAGPTFDQTMTGPAWSEDTFPPFYTDFPDARTFLFYGPLGIMVKVGYEGNVLDGQRVTIGGTGAFSLLWKNEPFAAATPIGTKIAGRVTYDHAWEGAISSGVTSPVGAVSAFMRTMLDDVDAAMARDTLGLGGLSTNGGTSIAAGAFEIGGGAFVAPAAGKGRFHATAVDGLVISGNGSSTDLVLANKAGATVADVATGTVRLNLHGGLKFNALPPNYASDAAAAAGGIAVGEVYRNGSAMMVRAA